MLIHHTSICTYIPASLAVLCRYSLITTIKWRDLYKEVVSKMSLEVVLFL